MKRTISTLALALSICALSCKKDSNNSVPLPDLPATLTGNDIPTELKPVAEFLTRAYNVKLADIIYRSKDSTFVMEGDMAVKRQDAESDMKEFKSIPKLSVNKQTPEGVISHRMHSTLANLSDYPVIKIFNNCSSTGWKNATSQAIRNWNHPSIKAITKIRMTEVYSSSGADCVVSEVGYANGTYAAEARPPFRPFLGSRKVGDWVRIFTYANSYPEAYKSKVITHELGHIIGITHTGTNEGSYIPGSPTTDTFSIMNSGGTTPSGNGDHFRGFTTSDLWALHAIHGITIQYAVQVAGAAKRLAGGEDNFMYAIDVPQQWDLTHYFRRWDGGTNWNYMLQTYDGRGIKMATTTGGQYYYITADKKIWKGQVYPYPTQLPGEAIDIAANSDGELFIVSNTYHNADGNKVMKWNGTGWVEYQPAVNAPTMGAKKIAIPPGVDPKPFIVTNNGRVLHHYGNDYTWTEIGGAGINALDIATCNSKKDISGLPILYIINGASSKGGGNYGIQRWTGNDWFELPGGGVTVAVDDLGHPWHTNAANNIYRDLNF